MKKLAILFLFLVLTACNQPNNTGADNYRFVGADFNYRFGAKQYENSRVTVDIVTYKSRTDLQKEARKYGVTDPNLAAFTLLFKNDQGKCTIHMMDPSISYEPEFVGHEFLHCVYGQWHTDNKSTR